MYCGISVVLQIFISSIVGWVSAKISYRMEIKKGIYEKRQELYTDIFLELEKLQKNPYLIFNNEDFIHALYQISARAKLYASKGILKTLNPFLDNIIERRMQYINLYESEKAMNELDNRIQEKEADSDYIKGSVEEEFCREAELYIENHVISENEIIKTIDNLSSQIRKELKTK